MSVLLLSVLIGLFSFNIAAYGQNVYHISTPEGIIELSKKVNSGTCFEGTTVVLDSDIQFTDELSAQFVPIGLNDHSKYFKGTFDGQGHTFFDFKILYRIQNVALFGISFGMTFKNVIFDVHCRSENNFSSKDWMSHAAMVGYCDGLHRPCMVENCVNLASVHYTGSTTNGVYVGGIVGHLRTYGFDSTIKNCVNYGIVSNEGQTSNMHLGGIIADFDGGYKRVQNSLNYGTIYHQGWATGGLWLGGIIGETYIDHLNLENCVNSGKVINLTPQSCSIGNIVGCVSAGTGSLATSVDIVHSFWSKETEISNPFGVSSSLAVITASGAAADITPEFVKEMNDYALNKGWNRWLLNDYSTSITFIINNGRGFTTTSKLILYPDFPSTAGFIFDGWYTDPFYTVSYNETTVGPDKTDLLLYGLYGKIITVTFESGGVALNHATKGVVQKSRYGKLPEPLSSGYNLLGWFTERKGNGTKIEEDTIVTASANHKLYAHWDVKTFLITFETFGGNDIEDIDQVFGEPLALPVPVKEGYQFEYWCTDEDLTEKLTETAMPGHDLELYAKYTPLPFNVTFVFDNGTEPQVVSFLCDEEEIVYPQDPKREGYTFDGWNESYEGDWMPPWNLAVTALWKINQYDVTFVFDNKVTPDDERSLDYNSAIVYPPEPTRVGHSFAGWDKTIANVPAHNVIITAQWKINNYTLTFVFDDGSTADDVRKVDYDKDFVYPPNPAKTGYTFSGWDSELTKMPANDLTITAQWTINQYNVTFVFDDKVTPDDKRSLDYNSEIVYPAEPTRTGHSFAGWDKTIANVPADNVIITAQWKINNYTLTFVFGNGNESEVSVITYDAAFDYPDDPERTGYTFAGWDSELTTMPGNDLTITAQWTAIPYSVTFILDNGHEPIVKVYKYEDEIEYPTVRKEGYVFKGWSSDIARMPTENITITASWEIGSYTIIVDTGNGTTTNITFNSNETIPEPPPAPEKEGFIFDGWYTDENCTQPFNKTGTAGDGDFNLYPKYTPIVVSSSSSDGKAGAASKGASEGGESSDPSYMRFNFSCGRAPLVFVLVAILLVI